MNHKNSNKSPNPTKSNYPPTPDNNTTDDQNLTTKNHSQNDQLLNKEIENRDDKNQMERQPLLVEQENNRKLLGDEDLHGRDKVMYWVYVYYGFSVLGVFNTIVSSLDFLI